jgi:ethanolamine utilization protein EutM
MVVPQALGIVETRGIAAAVAVADVMLKAANVTLIGKLMPVGESVTVMLRGDFSAVQVALDAAKRSADTMGEEIRTRSIERTHARLDAILSAADDGNGADD